LNSVFFRRIDHLTRSCFFVYGAALNYTFVSLFILTRSAGLTLRRISAPLTIRRAIICLVILLGLSLTLSHADDTLDIQLEWLPNTEPDLVGYRVYQSDQSGVYTFGLGNGVADVPKGTETVTLNDVPDGIWYWVVTAYDDEELESAPSNEVSNFAITSPQNGFYVNATNDGDYPVQGLAIVDTLNDVSVESNSIQIGGPFPVDTSGDWSGACDFTSLNQGNVTITATLDDMSSNDVTGIYDRVPPGSSASVPTDVGGMLTIPWNASDHISGVASAQLWCKPPGRSWANTGNTGTGSSGTFHYTPTQGSGIYYFATRAVDKAGNWESKPNGDGDTSINFTASTDPNNPTGVEGAGGCFIDAAASD
jgi:hypothetical protein